jgi:hypothetical protein
VKVVDRFRRALDHVHTNRVGRLLLRKTIGSNDDTNAQGHDGRCEDNFHGALLIDVFMDAT